MMRRPLLVTSAVTLAIAACSGASGSDDLFKGSSFGGSSSGSSGASGASTTSSSTSSSGGTSSGGSTSSTSSTSSSSTSSTSSTGGTDAGVDARPPPGKDPGIYCGKSFCAPGQQICCATGPSSARGYACAQEAAACTGIPIACDDAADCGTQHCCGQFSQLTGYVSVSCQTSCDGTAPNGDLYVELCSQAVTPDTCATGTTCQVSGGLPGFSICK